MSARCARANPEGVCGAQPVVVTSPLDVFDLNRRTILLIASPAFGRVACVVIGALQVGSIHLEAAPGDRLAKVCVLRLPVSTACMPAPFCPLQDRASWDAPSEGPGQAAAARTSPQQSGLCKHCRARRWVSSSMAAPQSSPCLSAAG